MGFSGFTWKCSVMMMVMMMMNFFCGMVDQRKAFSLISSWDHYQRSSLSRISDTPQAGFEPAQNLSSGFVEWSCAVVITTTPRRHSLLSKALLPTFKHLNAPSYPLIFRRKVFSKVTRYLKIVSVTYITEAPCLDSTIKSVLEKADN